MTRRLPIGPLVTALGALLLAVSLFLAWYEPELNAWKVYEVLDLLLLALALAAIAAALARLGVGPRSGGLRDALLPASLAAFVIVVAQLLNHPPAAIERGNEVGIYLALAGSALMAAGAIATVARISLAFDVERRPGAEAGSPPAATTTPADPPAASAAPPDAPTEVVDGGGDRV